MPRIFDNIDRKLLPALQETLQVSVRGDFCVGYFNLRGWRQIDSYIEKWSGEDGECCRLLIGMQKLPKDELSDALDVLYFDDGSRIDNKRAIRLKRDMAEEFRQQLMAGAPSNNDQKGLRVLADQLRSGKVVVKLFLRHLLHAKLYLFHRSDAINPMVGYVGSSNLTFAGLSHQGELNLDVLDEDACKKLAVWFNDLWDDNFCLDITDDLLRAIEESWVEQRIPYHIYIKIAYHLSSEARAGLREFSIPRDFRDKLLNFQEAAIKIAARHLQQRGGVIIGDVVGLGKTLMATALARIFSDAGDMRTLIICPKNLEDMWEGYAHAYNLHAKVLPMSKVIKELPDLRRYTLVVIDESHNLRNRDSKRYKAIQKYIRENDSKCILLSATPYNKSYIDLSNQLRLFIDERQDIGIRPERLIREKGESALTSVHQIPLRSLAAFEKSEYVDDWRDLMRLYLVRRTRSFIREHYAELDKSDGKKYLKFSTGERSYFPDRIPKTVKFTVRDGDDNDSYARLFSDDIVGAINGLLLPRYGLGNYINESSSIPLEPEEANIAKNLSRAGRRLMGFCRTNLLKRMESSGHVFLLSLEHLVLRNYVYLHALSNGLPLPIGSMDVRDYDDESDLDFDSDGDAYVSLSDISGSCRSESDFEALAEKLYKSYSSSTGKRFSWIGSHHFQNSLESDLRSDCASLISCLVRLDSWDPDEDEKLKALKNLLLEEHASEKVLIFSQFSDTIGYLHGELERAGVLGLASVTGSSNDDPTQAAYRFSPRSNGRKVKASEEIRVLLATDVLSEGQNLQDGYIVVNYDLPWAIIRLIQRAGRVDRLGQQSEEILCYSFLPAEGIERLINLRGRVGQRLEEQANLVGTDESFFEDEKKRNSEFLDLYHEKAGILDGEDDKDVDLSSHAYQIWKNAIKQDSSLQDVIENMPYFVHSSKSYISSDNRPDGVLVYVRSAQENDMLAWIDSEGNSVTESQFDILQAASCDPKTKAIANREEHHDLVVLGTKHVAEEEHYIGGALGSPRRARFMIFSRLDKYLRNNEDTLLASKHIKQALQQIYDYILTTEANDLLYNKIKNNVLDEELIDIVLNLYHEDKLCQISEGKTSSKKPRIVCSMGLWKE